MMVPGSNILGMALSVIQKQTFKYFAFRSRELNSIGLDETQYRAGVTATGSVQPVPRVLYQAMGLDFQGNYYKFFLPKNIIDIARDVSGDQMEFGGKRFQCLSKTDWYGIDGWDEVLCVEVNKKNEGCGC